jgi:phage terminase large subunit GpA-like protein
VHVGAFLRLVVEYLSGSQLRYECPCPACGVFTEPAFKHLVFAHCNEALPGQPPDYNRDRIMRETWWQCPHCDSGRVHEGDEKKGWVRAGRWVETPLPERRRKDKYPRPEPGRWSAKFSALTDIAFDSLTWGNIVRRFLDALGDPVKLTAFNNELMAEPEPLVKVEDTTLDHLKRLIPDGKRHAAYRIKNDDGTPRRIVPCLQHQLHYIGMAVDVQMHTLKWSVRAHYKDGTAPLLDCGTFPRTSEFRELTAYIDTQRWDCEDDGPSRGIYRCYVDVGGEGSNFYDVLNLSVSHPRVQGIKGEGEHAGRVDRGGIAWKTPGYTKPNFGGGRTLEVPYWTIAAGFWERRLYEECIQKFPDPYRHRIWAPSLYFPEDIEDSFLTEFTHMHLELEKGKPRWIKKPATAKNDFADCDKMHLVMDWNLRLKWLQREGLPAAQPEEGEAPATDDTAGATPPKEYKLTPRPRMA